MTSSLPIRINELTSFIHSFIHFNTLLKQQGRVQHSHLLVHNSSTEVADISSLMLLSFQVSDWAKLDQEHDTSLTSRVGVEFEHQISRNDLILKGGGG